MIQFISDNFKTISQESYNSLVDNLNIHSLTCTCNKQGACCLWGSYSRFICVDNITFSLRVQRVRCMNCLRTHALLPTAMIPYFRTLLYDVLDILQSKEDTQKLEAIMIRLEIDESLVRFIIKRYKHYWKEVLQSHKLQLKTKDLSKHCFFRFNKQFMQFFPSLYTQKNQTKRFINILFVPPT